MSLYVGHLSPHVRQEELERVFQRFGRCSVQLKDGYGFAVYEVTANAERALRALRGKNICGEQISLNWSNRQPRPLQRHARSIRYYRAYPEKNFRGGNGRVGIRGSQDQGDFSTGAARVMYNHGGHQLDNATDKEAGHIPEDINEIKGHKGVNSKEGVIDEDGTGGLDLTENGRWGEGNGIENGDEFDHYEPYHGYNRSNEHENIQMTSSYGSPKQGSSQEKRRREHSFDDTEWNPDKSTPKLTCYNCGLVGHIMRNCRQRDARREKFGKFNHRRDEISFRGKGEGRLKRFRPNSWGGPDASRDPLMSRYQTRLIKEPHSEKARGVSKRSETSPEIRKNRHSNLRGDSQTKKRSKLEHEAPKKSARSRRQRRSRTSSLSSDSSTTSSQSHSRSPRSISNTVSHSCSRSASSWSQAASSSSKSASLSSYSKSVSSRSKSRSRSSFARSLSLSVSLERKTTRSPKNKQMDDCMDTSLKGNVDTVTSPADNHLENAKPKVTCSRVDDENAITPFKADNEINGEHIGQDGDDVWYSTFGFDNSESYTCTDQHKDTTCLAYENHRQNNDYQEAPLAQLGRDGPSKSEPIKSTKITTQEMFLALQHYGLATPEEGLPDISVKEYFGAARLWPWEMIYYRRLKKGPISTENYARRLEQNKEFGIVDKYIRNSSGWGECSQDDT